MRLTSYVIMALLVDRHSIGLHLARSTTTTTAQRQRQRQHQHQHQHHRRALLAKSAAEGDLTRGKRVRLGPDLRPRECVLCIDGRGVVECHNCDGQGCYYTKPGLAGKSNTVGVARCKMCNGTGKEVRRQALVCLVNEEMDGSRAFAFFFMMMLLLLLLLP